VLPHLRVRKAENDLGKTENGRNSIVKTKKAIFFLLQIFCQLFLMSLREASQQTTMFLNG